MTVARDGTEAKRFGRSPPLCPCAGLILAIELDRRLGVERRQSIFENGCQRVQLILDSHRAESLLRPSCSLHLAGRLIKRSHRVVLPRAAISRILYLCQSRMTRDGIDK